MNQDTWTAVDRYHEGLFAPPDPVFEAALAAAAAAGMPPINVPASQGRLLELLARSVGARAILEVGTLAAYSTIWLARALPPGGRLLTLEKEERYAAVARENLARAGLSDTVEVRVGAALDTLPTLTGPFDLAFIDADKANCAPYFEQSLTLVRPGGLIVVDNVVRGGAVIDPDGDASVQGVRRLNALMAAEPRAMVTSVQTVGAKGYDGFALALVL